MLYIRPCNRLLSVTQLVAWVCLSLALLLFSLNSIWLLPFTVWVVLGVAYFGLSFLANTSFRRFDLEEHDRRAAEHLDARQPSVDVFLPNCGEDLAVLANAIRHVAALEYAGASSASGVSTTRVARRSSSSPAATASPTSRGPTRAISRRPATCGTPNCAPKRVHRDLRRRLLPAS